MTERAAGSMLAGGQSTLTYNDVAQTVQGTPSLDFLKEIVPQKMQAAVALQRMLVTRAAAAAQQQ